MRKVFILIFLLKILSFNGYSFTKNKPLIFPIPLEVQLGQGTFNIDSAIWLINPEKGIGTNNFLTKLIHTEFIDNYSHPLNVVNVSNIPTSEKFILIGAIADPLVKSYCKEKGLESSLKGLGEEGYVISVTKNAVVIAGNNEKGALLGWASLRQIINDTEGGLKIPHIFIKDAPKYAFRGIKLFLPGRDNIPFFKRFIKDFVALYKFNKVILELNANMRLDQHPELNIGTVKFAQYLKYGRLGRPPGVHQEFQNSSHQDNADSGILEKEEVADLVNYIRDFNIEVIPELPSLTHSYYLLFDHKDLAENMNQKYPDTYCPLKSDIYKIYFNVLDEYIEVIRPDIIQVGHDEWRMEKDLCDLCRGKDYGKLFAEDLNKIYKYLHGKGIKTAIWGDHLLESVRKKDHQLWKTSTGYEYKIPGALSAKQVTKLIPKDILIFNWFYNDINNDKKISDFGFQQIYANLHADIENWNERSKIKDVLGGAPSSWAASTERNIGKDQLYDFLGSSNLLWSHRYLPVDTLAFIIEPMISEIRKNLSGKMLPSEIGAKASIVDITYRSNSSLGQAIQQSCNLDLINGTLETDNIIFKLEDTQTGKNKKVIVVNNHEKSSKSIEINEDFSSIIFLHASAKKADNINADYKIYNFEETADLLGWYEIIYEDGFIETIPVRYGLNILDWRWRQRIRNKEKSEGPLGQNKYAYEAKAVECSSDKSSPVTFFAFEWQNIRFGKKIREVKLKSIDYTKENRNAIILLAVSISKNKHGSEAEGSE